MPTPLAKAAKRGATLQLAADHRGRPGAEAEIGEMAAHQLAALRDRAGQRQAEPVEDRFLAERDHVVGQVRGLRFADERGDVARQLVAGAGFASCRLHVDDVGRPDARPMHG